MLLGRFGRGRVGKKNAKHVVAHAEAMPQAADGRGFAFENNIHVKTRAVLFVSHADKITLIHFLHRLDFAAGRRDFGGNLIDRVFEAFFFAGHLEYK